MAIDTRHTTPLLNALEQLAPRTHLCSIYETPEEHFAVAVPFIKIGLDRGEKCIYIADDGTQARVALDGAGVDVERAVATGQLTLEKKESAYLKHGSFDPEWMFTFWADAAAQATRQGFQALRVTGDTEWVHRGATGVERWIEYESQVTHLLAHCDCVLLCQYNRQLFPPELVLDIIRTHPTVIYRGVVSRNMYYVPPDEFLSSDHAERELERLLTNMREREEIEYQLRQQHNDLRESEEGLRRSASLLRVVLDTLPVGVGVVDGSGNLILSNPAQERLWSTLIRSGPHRYAESKGWGHATGKRLAPEEWPSVRAFAHGETTVNAVIDIEAFDGTRKTMQTSAVPIRDADERITGAVVVNEDISDRKTAERELTDSYNLMRTLTTGLMQAQDDERRRIAQMLHETTAQDLAALKMYLSRLNRTIGYLSEPDRAALTESITLAEQSIKGIRTLSYLLHPPFLDEMGLLSALRWYAGGFAERSGIKVELELPETFERLPLDTETALFRIVQESLTNIHRHAGSETAHIRLRSNPDVLVLEIEDRGHGIAGASLKNIMSGGGGVGIASMSGRIKEFGGRLDITSNEQGTTVRMVLPLGKEAG